MIQDDGAAERESLILKALDDICDSEYFSGAEQIKKFLRYVVAEALTGRADRIKSYSVGVEALGKDADFDPTQDPIVRITANRLRGALAKYYNESTDQHRVLIKLPKGRYVPDFDFQAPDGRMLVLDDPPAPRAAPPIYWQILRRRSAMLLASFGLAVAGFFAWPTVPLTGTSNTLGQVWIIVQKIETGGSIDPNFGRILGDQMIAQATRYDGVSIVDAQRSPNLDILAGPMSDSLSSDQHIFSLAIYIGRTEQWMSVRWYLTDVRTNEVMWAADHSNSFEAGQDPNTIVQAIAAEMLGLEGAIPVIMDRVRNGDLGHDGACVARAQRDSYANDDLMLDGIVDCLTRVVQNHPQNGHAWALLSRGYHRKARLAASLGGDVAKFRKLQHDAARQANDLSPETFFPHLAQLIAAYDTGPAAAWENLADRMLLRYGGDQRLKIIVGEILISQGQSDRGRTLIEEGLMQIPVIAPMSYMMLVLESYAAGDLVQSKAYLETKAAPTDYRYWLLKTVVYAGLGQHERAKQAWNALSLIRPEYQDNVCDDIRHANLHYSHYNQMVSDLAKVVSDLPERSCGMIQP